MLLHVSKYAIHWSYMGIPHCGYIPFIDMKSLRIGLAPRRCLFPEKKWVSCCCCKNSRSLRTKCNETMNNTDRSISLNYSLKDLIMILFFHKISRCFFGCKQKKIMPTNPPPWLGQGHGHALPPRSWNDSASPGRHPTSWTLLLLGEKRNHRKSKALEHYPRGSWTWLGWVFFFFKYIGFI